MGQSPVFIGLFISLLALVQIVAFERQFALGFLPFVHEPTRVPFSWDMFANRVERCTMSWSPAVKINGRALSSLRDVEVPFEWDVTYDYVIHYRMTGEWLCHLGAQGETQVNLRCFIQNGTEFNDQFTCR